MFSIDVKVTNLFIIMARPKVNPDSIEKICPTCNNVFKIKYTLRNIRTYCSRKCSNNNINVKEKIKESQTNTFIEKYGTHPMKLDQTKEKLKLSIRTKYGVDWISKKSGWYDTVKKNNKLKYGVETYNNIQKIKETCINNYGVDNPTKYKEIRESINLTIRNNHFDCLKQYCQSNNIELLFNKTEYKGYKFENKYKFKCIKCGYVFIQSINNSFNSLFCEKCDPDRKNTVENSFFNFLSELTPQLIIKRRDRTILNGKELDFYLPEQKIAFEINGLYWHSENGRGITRNYHNDKTKICLDNNIHLIHVFEFEWINKCEIIKSIIKTILNCNNNNIIYARKCELKDVDIKEKNIFLNDNHLQGEDKSSIKLGLYSNDKLVSIMTFNKKSRFDKNIQWELSRFCNLQNTIVIGGASKLFSYFKKQYKPKSIVSYSDRRFFNGNIYNTLGFKFINNTNPSYYYISPNYKNIYNRMNFQKHLLKSKLKLFNPQLSEWENMKLNGWDRIWDCGNSKWVWINN